VLGAKVPMGIDEPPRADPLAEQGGSLH
jgi:hypothetical protein